MLHSQYGAEKEGRDGGGCAGRKEAIERFLTNLGVLKTEPFLLNSLFNICLLKPDLHTIWDKYASILFCPRLETINQLKEYFRKCNTVWDAHAIVHHVVTPQRPSIDEGAGNLRASGLNLYVLHSTSFLPHGEPIFVCANPPYLDAEHPTVNAPSIWEAYRYDSTTSKLMRAIGTPTPLTITIRHGDLSTVAVILNADAKIEHAQESRWQLSAEVLELKKAIDAFKLEFYFLPNLKGSSSRRTGSDDSNAAQNRRDLSPHLVAQSMLGSRSQTLLPPIPSSDDHMDEERQEIGLEDEGSDEEDEELEEEDDDEASWSLSPEEYNLGLKKLNDPSVPIQERMAIGSLLLTGKRYLPTPRAPGV
ncbi:hypothetical protein FB451DRAFT_1236488 [Mycena latifolia]|nr:hypothetical protein FB451DRAFT_1236488 [Mycena latifolia]